MVRVAHGSLVEIQRLKMHEVHNAKEVLQFFFFNLN